MKELYEGDLIANINLYKINNNLKDEFITNLEKNYNCEDLNKNINFQSKYFDNINLDFSMKLYLYNDTQMKELSWIWICNEFNVNMKKYPSRPKAILLIREIKKTIENEIEQNEENFYAIPFGQGFHSIKHYSDRNWALNFAERLDINRVNSMSILSPNAIINKRINNYRNSQRVEFNSGESLTKLDASVFFDESFEDLKTKITISNSIFLKIDNPNLDKITKIVDYISYINSKNIKYKIPYFREITSKKLKEKLDNQLVKNIYEDIKSKSKDYCIDICEFRINDGNEIFFNKFDKFILKLNSKSMTIDYLNIGNIYNFIENLNLRNKNRILEILVICSDYETNDEFKFKLKDLIMYDSVSEAYIFDEGQWLEYNEVYLKDLAESLSEIDIEYDKKFDFKKSDYLEFLNKKSLEENNIKFSDLSEKNKNSFKKKWYKERVFNLMREADGYICNDRYNDNVNGHKIEISDLFKLDEKSMYAVKIGSNSSNLDYVVDQSLIPMRMLDNNELKEIKNKKLKKLSKNDIKNVYLWLILTRKPLPIENGKPNLNKLNSLLLKNRINDWKKEVINSRRNPKIRINYINF